MRACALKVVSVGVRACDYMFKADDDGSNVEPSCSLREWFLELVHVEAKVAALEVSRFAESKSVVTTVGVSVNGSVWSVTGLVQRVRMT